MSRPPCVLLPAKAWWTAALAVAVMPVAGCAITTGLDDGELSGSVAMAFYRLRGDSKAAPASASTAPNPLATVDPVSQQEFGLGGYEDDIAGRIAWSDGFAGLQFDYYALGMSTSRTGELNTAYGVLEPGDVVRGEAEMDEFRLAFNTQLFEHEVPFRGDTLRMRFGVGPAIALRDFSYRASMDVPDPVDPREQRWEIDDDGVVYGAIRGRLDFKEVSLTVDFRHAEDTTLGGDFEGKAQDFEIELGWEPELQNVRLFAGYRRQELGARGISQDTPYLADLVIDGFTIGFGTRF